MEGASSELVLKDFNESTELFTANRFGIIVRQTLIHLLLSFLLPNGHVHMRKHEAPPLCDAVVCSQILTQTDILT